MNVRKGKQESFGLSIATSNSIKQDILIFPGNTTLQVEKIIQEAQQVSKAILWQNVNSISRD